MNEKRFVLAFTISLLILLVYPYFLQKLYPPKAKPAAGIETAPIQKEIQPAVQPAPEEAALSPEEKKFDYEDAVFAATFSNIGGSIVTFSLKDFSSGRAHGNFLLDEHKQAVRGFSTRLLENGVWEEAAYSLEKKDRHAVVFSRNTPNGLRIRKRYWFLPEQHVFWVELDIENASQETRKIEHEFTASLFIGDEYGKGQHYIEADYARSGDIEVKDAKKVIKQGVLKDGAVDWAALEKKYFTVIVKPEAEIDHVRSSGNEQALTHYLAPRAIELAPGQRVAQKFYVFAGPKNYETLKAAGFGFEKILHTRFLGALWIYFLVMLKFFYKMFNNYGVAIIVLSSVIKLVFTPLTHMSFESMRKMQDLQPKLKHMQTQYKNDPQRLNKEVMELYKKHKVNPFGGCLPMLLQMPIFIALYQTFSCAIELRGAPFVAWIRDLSEPDQLFLLPFSIPLLGNQVNILPLIMIGTMVWQQKVTPQAMATPEQKMITNIMPIMFGFIFYGLPSGLVIYWIVNNILTIAHQFFIHKQKPAAAA